MKSLVFLFLEIVVVALALWAVVWLVPGVEVVGSPDMSREVTFVAVAAVFVVVNAVIGPILRFVGAPLTCLTLGLFALVINAVVFALVAWISQQIGLGLHIDGVLPAVLGAAVLAFARWVLSPLTGGQRRSR